MNFKTNTEKTILDICLKVAKAGKGCLIILIKGGLDYAPLIPQDIQKFCLKGNERRTEVLALVDGAVVVKDDEVIAYACQILNTKPVTGFGTRFAAANTASWGNTAFLTSEEDRKVRVLRDGKVVMQLDALEQGIESRTDEAGEILQSIGFGTAATVTSNIVAPLALSAVGISFLPGVLVFGVSYYLLKKIFDNYKK